MDVTRRQIRTIRWASVPWSSNWYGVWRYRVAGERLPLSLAFSSFSDTMKRSVLMVCPGTSKCETSDSCVWPPRTCHVPHITVATAGSRHPSPHCAHITCLLSANVQQAPISVDVCTFFDMKEFSDTSLFRMDFHVRRHFARLLLCCYLSHSNKTCKLLAGRFNLYCHTTSIRL
jgi:hypothetical protein